MPLLTSWAIAESEFCRWWSTWALPETCNLPVRPGTAQLMMEILCMQQPRKMNPFCIPFAITNMSSALLAMDIGFMGPNYSISTACATGNYCIFRSDSPPAAPCKRIDRICSKACNGGCTSLDNFCIPFH